MQLYATDIKNQVSDTIDRIREALPKSESKIYGSGIQEGLLGLSLYYYYCHLYTQDQNDLDKCIYNLEKVISDFSNHPSKYYIMDLVDLGKYLCFLDRQKLITTEEVQQLLLELTKGIDQLLNQKIIDNDLDMVGGIIALGHFYLDAYPIIQDFEKQLIKIVKHLENTTVENSNSLYWHFYFRDKNKPTIETGFLHGLSGVIYFLALVFQKGILEAVCKNLINKSISFLNTYKYRSGINLFPFDTRFPERIAYQSLVYGDIGIGYSMLSTGTILNDQHYKNIGLDILRNASTFKDHSNIHIKDAELIYGASGLFALFTELYKQEQDESFKEAASYWLHKTLSHGAHQNSWAGFDTYINGFDESIQLSFGHGIAGIAISLIVYQLDINHLDYLSFFNYKKN